MRRDRTWLDVAIFIALTAAFTAPFWYVARRFQGGPLTHEYVVGLMYGPAAAAFVLRRRVDLGLRVPERRWLVIGVAIPIGYVTITYAVGWAAGLIDMFAPAQVDGYMAAYKVTDLDGGAAIGVAAVWALTAQTLLNVLYAIGEELGWRGYLVPVLSRRLGLVATGVVSGVIWSLWHFPLMTSTTLEQHALFMVMVIAAAIVTAWLRLRSNSVWPSVLLHGTHNAWLSYVAGMGDDRSGWYGDETGVGIAVATTIIAVVVVVRDSSRSSDA